MLDAVKNSSFVKGVCRDTTHQPTGIGKPLYFGGRVVSFGGSAIGAVLEIFTEVVAVSMLYTADPIRKYIGDKVYWVIRDNGFKLSSWNKAHLVPQLEYLLQDIRVFSAGETFKSRYPNSGNDDLPLVSLLFV